MAMLRLASSSLVPNSLLAISSPRILSECIANCALSGTDQYIVVKSEINPNCICRNFSTDMKKLLDRKLVSFLKSEIKSRKLPLQKTKPSVPAHFPFTIRHHPGCCWDRNITLKRQLDGEKIDVLLYQHSLRYDIDTDSSDDSDNNGGDGGDDDSSSTYSNSDEQKIKSLAYYPGPSLELNVKISKENGTEMEFEVYASADEIRINSMSVKEPAAGSNSLICYGPSPVRDSELQLALGEFLEIRGIKKSYVKFLCKYGVWNSQRLRNVRSYEKLRMLLKKFTE